jgi:hypothetical protein
VAAWQTRLRWTIVGIDTVVVLIARQDRRLRKWIFSTSRFRRPTKALYEP